LQNKVSKILFILNAFCVGGRIMEYIMIMLGVCLSVIGYYGYNFIIFRRNQNSILKQRLQQLTKDRIEYQKARMKEANETYKKTGIFREMAIDSIVKQKLIFDEQTGRYIRLTEINQPKS
jgi:hypothetical protein